MKVLKQYGPLREAVIKLNFETYYFYDIIVFEMRCLKLMAKKNSRNTDILKETKNTTSPKIYSLLVKLVNEDREDLAEDVLKIDYLLAYTNTCIKDKDFKQAKETMEMAKNRIDKLISNGVDVEYLVYIYDGIKSKL